jgi:ParB-like chromosome segregation protein Spo0J
MLIPIDRIREEDDVRHIPSTPADDSALMESVNTLGQLYPILVSPSMKAGDYIVRDGHRRLRHGRQL